MRATVFVALLGAIAMLLALTALQVKEKNPGLVLFGISMILICGSAIPDLLKKESMETAEQLRDSDNIFIADQAPLIEPKARRSTKLFVAAAVGIVVLVGFVLFVVWAGF